MHSLAFLAGLIVSAVVATGLMVLAPREGSATSLLPAAIAVAGLSLALGYLAYMALVCVLLDIEPGLALKLVGPGLLALTMIGVIAIVFSGIVTPTGGSLMGYALLFVTGGVWLTLRPEAEDEE